MLNEKMQAVMDYVKSNVAERDELVHYIALSLLTKKNLFVLGDTGQSKSQVIDLFRQCIQGARQFKVLMSKQIDQEQLFGRLDLSSIVPGHVSRSIIDKDQTCLELEEKLKKSLEEGVECQRQ